VTRLADPTPPSSPTPTGSDTHVLLLQLRPPDANGSACQFAGFGSLLARSDTLAASSASSCSSPEGRHCIRRSKRARTSGKASPLVLRPNSPVCHSYNCCKFACMLQSSYHTISKCQQMSTDRANWDEATLRIFLELVIEQKNLLHWSQ